MNSKLVPNKMTQDEHIHKITYMHKWNFNIRLACGITSPFVVSPPTLFLPPSYVSLLWGSSVHNNTRCVPVQTLYSSTWDHIVKSIIVYICTLNYCKFK